MDGTKRALMLMTLLLLSTFVVRATGNTNVVVMLGDSTTLCKANKPGARLADYVQSCLAQQQLQAKIINSGVGGDTAKGGFTRLQGDVFAHAPSVVTISFGLNDTGAFKPDEYQEWMEKIVQSIHANTRANILLITSTPFNDERHAWRDKFRAKGGLDHYMDINICAAERAIAKRHGLRLCDLHEHFLAQFRKDPKLIDELILPDGVHLTDKGNEVAAQYVAAAIAEMLKTLDADKKKRANQAPDATR